MLAKTKINALFWLFILSYLLVFWLKVSHYLPSGLIRSYFNDLLCIPIVLYSATWLLRLFFWNSTVVLNWAQIAVAVMLFSVFFEGYAPKYYPVHTGDVWDVICYVMGGVIFWKLSTLF